MECLFFLERLTVPGSMSKVNVAVDVVIQGEAGALVKVGSSDRVMRRFSWQWPTAPR